MKARIGVADSAKVIEIEVESSDKFRSELEEAFSSDQVMYWFTDAKRQMVGVPVSRIAYVEIETEDSQRKVGFAPGT